jgi:V/A-type H+-transporting ATPase subunit K
MESVFWRKDIEKMKWLTIMAAVLILAIPVVILGQVPVPANTHGTETVKAVESDGTKAQERGESKTGLPLGLGYVAAALAVGLGSVGAGLAVGATASAAVGAIAEKEEIAGKALVFVGLAEGIAIYGLIIAIMILNRL